MPFINLWVAHENKNRFGSDCIQLWVAPKNKNEFGSNCIQLWVARGIA